MQKEETNSNRSRTIDRDSYAPAYAQLVRILRDQISQGVYLPGTKLPSEAELCKRYNISPMTVRRTIKILIEQDVVRTTQGKGTFVKPIDIGTITFKLEWLQNIFRNKNRTTVKMLEVSMKKADEQTAYRIGLQVDERIVFMRRLILYDNKPIIYHEENILYNPRLPIVEGEMEITLLHGLFEKKVESNLKKGKLQLSAVVLNEDQATLLELAEGIPAFKLEHVFYDFDDRPVSLGWFILRNDLPNLTATVGIWDS